MKANKNRKYTINYIIYVKMEIAFYFSSCFCCPFKWKCHFVVNITVLLHVTWPTSIHGPLSHWKKSWWPYKICTWVPLILGEDKRYLFSLVLLRPVLVYFLHFNLKLSHQLQHCMKCGIFFPVNARKSPSFSAINNNLQPVNVAFICAIYWRK